jgi:hypothetical protein
MMKYGLGAGTSMSIGRTNVPRRVVCVLLFRRGIVGELMARLNVKGKH